MVLLSCPSGKAPTKWRNKILERFMLEDGPGRRISVWREDVAKIPGEAVGGGDAAGGIDCEGHSDSDNQVGRRARATAAENPPSSGLQK